MSKLVTLIALLFFFSCNSPETRLKRLQHDFWEKFARQDFFEIQLKNEVLHLPLPPSSKASEQEKSFAQSLQKEANAIDKEGLSVENKKQLAMICTALDERVAHAGAAFFDPSCCEISTYLQQFSNHPELPLFLEKIPAYYTQIEQRWQTPEVRFVSKAVSESQTALDLLQVLGKRSDGKMLALTGAAEVSVKDFIGLCQSALLGNVLK